MLLSTSTTQGAPAVSLSLYLSRSRSLALSLSFSLSLFLSLSLSFNLYDYLGGTSSLFPVFFSFLFLFPRLYNSQGALAILALALVIVTLHFFDFIFIPLRLPGGTSNPRARPPRRYHATFRSAGDEQSSEKRKRK